ncbi:MAG TPA: YciI family protein [Gemmatimonadales bacterium]|nr:YciI family protein [Gemmatimonadales bacterium]
MYAIALIRYRAPLEQIEQVTATHRAYLASLADTGVLLASGPLEPRTGGFLLLRVPDGDPTALDRIREGDPYWQQGLVNYELSGWKPGIGVAGLDRMGAS